MDPGEEERLIQQRALSGKEGPGDRFFFHRMKGVKMKKKHEIICYSKREMDRQADTLIEQGYKVVRYSGVLSVQAICIPTYKVVFWR